MFKGCSTSKSRASVVIQGSAGSVGIGRSLLGPPPPEDCGPTNSVNPESEGSHSEIAVVGPAHFLHGLEPIGHVSPQLIVHLILVPQETLYVLHIFITYDSGFKQKRCH